MRLHDRNKKEFASDNYSGIHPQVLNAITDANEGHQVSYGYDEYSKRLLEEIKRQFGSQAEIFPVFGGTGANVIALTAMMPRWGAVLCANSAHINTDEGGAPERMTGLKLLPVPNELGKISPESIQSATVGFGDEHVAQPAVISISQSSELGTVYSPDEIQSISDFASNHHMRLHMDGARLWNAAAASGVSLRAITVDAGVDVLSLGGTKNGLLGAEAVVVLNPDAVEGLVYLRKMTMQLASKMRFLSAQFLALFENDLGIATASQANKMAGLLRSRLESAIQSRAINNLSFSAPTEANAVFASIESRVSRRLRKSYAFYDWDTGRNEVRWMCSFDTTESDVENFVEAIIEALHS